MYNLAIICPEKVIKGTDKQGYWFLCPGCDARFETRDDLTRHQGEAAH